MRSGWTLHGSSQGAQSQQALQGQGHGWRVRDWAEQVLQLGRAGGALQKTPHL